MFIFAIPEIYIFVRAGDNVIRLYTIDYYILFFILGNHYYDY